MQCYTGRWHVEFAHCVLLHLQATLNQGLLQSEDVVKAASAVISNEKPVFAKL